MRREGKNENLDGLKYRRSVKVIAFLTFILAVTILVGSMLSARLMWGFGIFSSTQAEVEEEINDDTAKDSGSYLLSLYISGQIEYLEMYCGEFRNLEFEVTSGIPTYATEGVLEEKEFSVYSQSYVLGDYIFWSDVYPLANYNDNGEVWYYTIKSSQDDWVTSLLSEIRFTEEEIEEFEQKQYLDYVVDTNVYLDKSYPVVDVYYINNKLVNLAYDVSDYIWYSMGLSLILCCGLFLFLLTSAGYRKGHKERVVCGTARLPYEVFAIAGLTVFGLAIVCVLDGIDGYYYGSIQHCVVGLIGFVLLAGLGTIVLMDLVVRVSTGSWKSNFLLIRLWKWLRPMKRMKKICEGISGILGTLIHEIPTIWKAVLFYLVVNFWALLMILFNWFGPRFFMLVIANAVLAPILAYCCIMFKKMQVASKELGEGNLSYEVDTKYCFFEFKEMGESLNSIADGMESAVESKMKSERMKTELISNVSHDIKTPLTSIVNYADLISKEETENPKIGEYCEILLRQSDRLRRLTEDLVHASKVTTGNVEVHLAPCDVGVLLSQAIGEYEEKMSGADLKIVSRQPDESIVIEADGRHMWRVFDNLLNNICKYAQRGTRVYLILQKIEEEVYITFKNISEYELNISEEELMERFVRGDKSRHSEGNGLGLSIAKSLVEVQGGSMRVAIDGDLFKVVIRF